jgi:polyhydroxyalkanoate synthesis regulator phasin
MSDILEDQKIHYIVKDYRRMYNQCGELVKELKRLQDEVLHKDNRIRDLERQVENLKNQTPPEPPAPKIPKDVKRLLSETQVTIDASMRKLEKRIAALTTASENITTVKELLNQ